VIVENTVGQPPDRMTVFFLDLTVVAFDVLTVVSGTASGAFGTDASVFLSSWVCII
jgi:hypothetical protein